MGSFSESRTGQIVLAKHKKKRDKVKQLLLLAVDIARENPKKTKIFFIALILVIASINYDRLFGFFKSIFGWPPAGD